MIVSIRSRVCGISIAAALFLLPATLVRAQNNIRARVMLMVDTSGSMSSHFQDGNSSGGDGSTGLTTSILARDTVGNPGLTPGIGFQIQNGAPVCPAPNNANYDGVNSRMFAAKQAVRNVINGAGSIDWGLMRYTGTYCAFSNTFSVTGNNCTTDWDCRLSGGTPEFCVGGKCGLDRNLCVNNSSMGLSDRRTGNCARTNVIATTYNGTCGSSVNSGNALCATPQTCYKDADCNGAKAGQCAVIPGSAASSCQCNGGFSGCPAGYTCTGGRCVYSQGCQNPGGTVVIDPSTPGSNALILPWVDGIEDFRDAGGGVIRNPELRGVGNTPLAGSARSATTWYNAIKNGNLDAQILCRPYITVLLTDGADTCDSNDTQGPVAAAQSFVAATVSGARVLNKVYVVGLAFQNGDPTVTVLNNMAAAGGTTSARFANSQQDIQAALADIVASSVLIEKCNNADDDCNGACDEPFPDVAVSGQSCNNKRSANACDNGALQGTHCYASGTYVCSVDLLSEVCSAQTCQQNPALCPVAEASCNNLDDDCNGVVDDCTPFVAGSCCVNKCPACNLAGVPLPETCNGCDDDCDGTVDNHLTDTGKGCGLSLGICEPGTTYCCQEVNPGVMACTQSQVQPQGNNLDRLVCLGGRGPGNETCNGVDDNCNGVIDEVSQSCYPFLNGTPGVGICRAGLQQCNAMACGVAPSGCCPGLMPPIANGKSCPGNSSFGACSGAVGPRPELCNGLDEDCNGAVDDGITDVWANAACCPSGNLADCQNSGLGVRCKTGLYACAGGARVCNGAVPKSAEVCNGIDDDCNGIVDDVAGIGQACSGNGVNTTGACRGAWMCNGMMGPGPGGLTCAQAVGPMPEVCNGIDDNCNGAVDDNPADVGKPCGDRCPGGNLMNCVGACMPGTTICSGGKPLCNGGVGPNVESCNGIDDDCNGAKDDVMGVGTQCPGGGNVVVNGVCTAAWACVGGMPGPGPNGLTCQQAKGPTPETCNGVDDDCNGMVDDNPGDVGGQCGDACPGGKVQNCVGQCKPGKAICLNGARLCDGSVGPSLEVCDGTDNDCNGVTDDKLADPWLGMACCPSGNLADCTNSGGSMVCKTGVFACVNGGRVCNGGVARSPEVCDSIDNDCNGRIDDVPGIGLPCSGGGVITQGHCTAELSCTGMKGPGPNGLTCTQKVAPGPELCNSIDDDCDGVVDNNLKDPRLGVVGGPPCMPLPVGQDQPPCAPGTTACSVGKIICVGQVLPMPNVCDKPPTDCTGMMHAGECPPGLNCQDSMCVKPCAPTEFPCPGGFLCDPRTMNCIPDKCAEKMCPMGTRCVINAMTGEADCIDLCKDVTCPDGGRCEGGLCRDCRHFGCAADQICLGQPPKCVEDLCKKITCASDEYCDGKGCHKLCSGSCPTAQVCSGGKCIDDPCYQKECPAGRVCNIIDNQGICIDAVCNDQDPISAAKVCAAGTACCRGNCKNNACGGVTCPEDFTCGFDALCGPTCVPRPPRDRVVGAGGGGFSFAGCSVGGGVGVGGGNGSGAGLVLVLIGLMAGALVARRRRLRRVAAVGLALGLGLVGCEANPYCLNCDNPDQGGRPDATGGGGWDLAFSLPLDMLMQGGEMCVVTNNGVEACDHFDNDCNGTTDDVDPAKLAKDPNNCGACGNRCDYTTIHRYGDCAPGPDGDGGADPGHCIPGECQPGWNDIDKDEANGCEYACTPTNGGVEICDGRDNDCNGTIDDGFGYPDYAMDASNCGGCGSICNLPGAVAKCVADPNSNKGLCAVDHCINNGVDTYRHMGAMPGVLNTSGCEYHCPKASMTVTMGAQDCDNVKCMFAPETCNGVDDDCDFQVDDNPTDVNIPCGDLCPGGDPKNCVGACKAGMYVCTAGVRSCSGVKGPAPELCDKIDNDCDGKIDDNAVDGWIGQSCCPSGNLADCMNGQAGGKMGVRCMLGAFACMGGVRACMGGVAQQPESCNNVDDNCNGLVDDVAGIGTSCVGNGVNSTGACSGAYVCNGNAPGPGPAGLTCAQKVGPAAETCNGVDDDCDGVVDDNPGDVGAACAANCPGGQLAKCIGACKAGAMTCVKGALTCAGSTGPGTESCNGADDDCNGMVDDIPSIGLPCSDNGVNVKGLCTAKYVCNGAPGPGAQGLTCVQVIGPKVETCNGLDEDCNGVVDDNPSDVGAACAVNCPGGQIANCVGACKAGAITCSGGVKVCTGSTGPGPETCDGVDNDCNGTVDDGFGYPLYNTDPKNCGSCGTSCALANAVSGCHSDAAIDNSNKGVCYVVSCNNTNMKGFSYVPAQCGGNVPARDGPSGVGCNYACPVWPTTSETCDGKDNNCNGQVDELKQNCAPDGLVAPPLVCASQGVCQGQNIAVVCGGANGWRCNYAGVPGIELDANGNLAITEKVCDAKDGNCNGVVDLDGFPTVGAACTAGVGACRRSGNIICVNSSTAGCNVSANPGAATDEKCNDKDDDCDGLVDERADANGFKGWRDPMVAVPKAGGGTVYVYAYEASRPDANNMSAGGSATRSCSNAGVLPWANVTATQASAACAAVKDSLGVPMRLCTEAEWQAACEGPGGAAASQWSMSSGPTSYLAQICNDSGQAMNPAVWATGSNGAQSVQNNKYCFTDWLNGARAWDMSGNLFEWTSSTVTAGGVLYNKMRGGSFNSPKDGATCEFDFDIARPAFANTDVGFRCCADNPP